MVGGLYPLHRTQSSLLGSEWIVSSGL
jgi:hypothetical protein